MVEEGDAGGAVAEGDSDVAPGGGLVGGLGVGLAGAIEVGVAGGSVEADGEAAVIEAADGDGGVLGAQGPVEIDAI